MAVQTTAPIAVGTRVRYVGLTVTTVPSGAEGEVVREVAGNPRGVRWAVRWDSAAGVHWPVSAHWPAELEVVVQSAPRFRVARLAGALTVEDIHDGRFVVHEGPWTDSVAQGLVDDLIEMPRRADCLRWISATEVRRS